MGVLKHGWLTGDHTYYFIDMEYCTQTLEDFIKEIAKESQVPQDSEMEPLNNLANPETLEAMNLAMLHGNVSMVQTSPLGVQGPPTSTNSTELAKLSTMPPANPSSKSKDSSGLSSSERFPEAEPIDWGALITVLKDITSGLIYIHSERFVHRDLKPRNGSCCS